MCIYQKDDQKVSNPLRKRPLSFREAWEAWFIIILWMLGSSAFLGFLVATIG